MVNKEQARTVKLIYRLFLDGYTFHSIARELTARGLEPPFSSKIKCDQCGSWYGAKVWHSKDKYRRTIYRCNGGINKACTCFAMLSDGTVIGRKILSLAGTSCAAYRCRQNSPS